MRNASPASVRTLASADEQPEDAASLASIGVGTSRRGVAGMSPEDLQPTLAVGAPKAEHGPQRPPPVVNEEAIERRVAELKSLSPIKYAVTRHNAAKELNVPVGLLDKLVKAEQPQGEGMQGRPIKFADIDPWPEPVEGAALLTELVAALLRYVVVTRWQAVAVALWIMITHAHDAFDISPRLAVRSVHKRSGKTRLFELLQRLVCRALGASGITPSALLRLIELRHPTMLIDEMDTLMGGNREMAEALRGLINSGFNRNGATFTKNVATPDNGYEPREFSTWTPLALAGIGNLPDTVLDRSIDIVMKRKLKTEKVQRLRRRDGADLNELARKAARWARDNFGALRDAEPEMPQDLNDRAADAWEPLVAIADLAGGDWPAQVRAAAVTLSGDHLTKDDDDDTLLLGDIRDVLDHVGADRLTSEQLVHLLAQMEGRPWAELNHGKPMTKFQLSKRLKKYGVSSGTLRTGEAGETLKGYYRSAFDDVFARYLPPISTRHLVTSPEKQGENTNLELVTPHRRDELETAQNLSNSARCDDVTSSTPPHERESDAEGRSEVPSPPQRKVARL
jgi:putative DNA primase/helicase